MTFTLTRTSANNPEPLVFEFPTKRAALTIMGYGIVDNGYGTKAEAQRFAATVILGTPATFGPLTFTLTKN